MPKFGDINEFTNPGGTPEPGPGAGAGGDLLQRVHDSILAFRDVLKIAKDLRGVKDELKPQAAAGAMPDYPPPKLPPGPAANPGPSNPASSAAFAKFMVQYGDTTIDELLKVIGPLTIKQLISMVQHGTRPAK